MFVAWLRARKRKSRPVPRTPYYPPCVTNTPTCAPPSQNSASQVKSLKPSLQTFLVSPLALLQKVMQTFLVSPLALLQKVMQTFLVSPLALLQKVMQTFLLSPLALLQKVMQTWHRNLDIQLHR